MTLSASSVVDQILDAIKVKIENGDWKIGQFLPNDDELCQELNVSKGVLSTALSRLDAIGILHYEPERGHVLVRDNVSQSLARSSKLGFHDYVDMAKVLRFRLLIEPFAAEQCAMLESGALARLIDELAHIYVDMQRQVDNPEQFVKADLLFHSRIASASGNELLSFAFDEVINVSLRTNELMNQAFGYNMGLYHHGKLLEALRNCDPMAAKDAMTAHLKSALDSIS